MKKLIPTILAFFMSNIALADGIKAKVSYIHYQEPSIMLEHGVALGAGFDVMLKNFQIEMEYQRALTHYESSNTGELTNTNMQFGELELTLWNDQLGYGLGYQLMDNNKEGMETDTGFDGYQRTNHHLYVTLAYDYNNFEFQLMPLIHGWHYSYVGDASNGQYENTFHNQWFGVGFQIDYETKWVKPYLEFWYVHQSEEEYNGASYWREPTNLTLDVGVDITWDLGSK